MTNKTPSIVASGPAMSDGPMSTARPDKELGERPGQIVGLILGTVLVLALWCLAAYRVAETRLADGWLSANTVFEAEIHSVVREKHWRAIVVHEGALLPVEIDREDRARLRRGDRICVSYVRAIGYAGRCRDGRLDPELRKGPLAMLVITSFVALCLPIYWVLLRSRRIQPGVPVTLPPRPRDPR